MSEFNYRQRPSSAYAANWDSVFGSAREIPADTRETVAETDSPLANYRPDECATPPPSGLPASAFPSCKECGCEKLLQLKSSPFDYLVCAECRAYRAVIVQADAGFKPHPAEVASGCGGGIFNCTLCRISPRQLYYNGLVGFVCAACNVAVDRGLIEATR